MLWYLLSISCKPRRGVSRGGTGRICVTISLVFVCVCEFQRKSDCTQHICQHLGAQTVFGFPTTGWDQQQKHTVWVQPEDRSAVTPLLHTHTHPLVKPLMAPEGPQFPILPLPISGLCLFCFLYKTDFSLPVSLSLLSSHTHTHAHRDTLTLYA